MHKSILEALRAQLLDRHPLSTLPEPVVLRAGALNTWGSNALAGNSLTRAEVEAIILGDRTPGGRPVRDVIETVQHMDVFSGLAGRTEEPIIAVTALELHALTFWRLLPDAGSLRKEAVRRRGHPDWLVPMLREWEEELAERELAGFDPFETAAWMHARFLGVNPFTVGNGRVARLLLGLHLLKHSWPPVHVLPGDREQYEDALSEGHSGNLVPLVAMIRVLMGRSLLLLLDQVGADEDKLMPVTRLAGDGPYSAKYLALRASQGELPAVKEVGQWRTSRRAVGLYRENLGKG